MGTISNVRVEPCTVTWDASGLGFIDGDIEISFIEDAVDITAHEEGTNVLTAIRTGHGIESIALTLKETNIDLIKFIVGQSGETYTPSGGSQVVGWGSSKDFTSMLTESKKLVLHPIVNAVGVLTRDLAFWKACPVPKTIKFSGENPQTVDIEFRIFPDTSKVTECRLAVYGDHSQDFSA